MNFTKDDFKKTLTEETWIELQDGFAVRVDYPVYPHTANISKLAILEATGEEMKEPSFAFYVRTIIKDFRGCEIEGKEYHPKIENNLLSVDDFNFIHGQGFTFKIIGEARKLLDFDSVDKKKF